MSEPPAAVLVIDLQVGMFNGVLEPPIHDGANLIRRVRAVTDWARRNGHKVGYVRHDGAKGDALAPGEPGWPVNPDLGQGADEPTFSKSVGDAFSQPRLGEWIDGLGARQVIVMGAQSDQCVAATVGGARARGLDVIVVGDAHSTWPWDGKTAEEIIAIQNQAFEAAGAKVVTTEALTAG